MSTHTNPPTPRERLVVVGNGMAGIRTLEELLAKAPDRYDITVFGAEPHPNYNRIMLSPVLAGEKTFEQIVLNGRDWYEANGIRLLTGDRVEVIDRANCTVTAISGLTVPYDKLLIATGSTPVIIPVPGSTLTGVVGFRDLADVDTMLEAAARGGRAVVIGGGLLGLEAANGLKVKGMDVTVLHLMDTLMERQLDRSAGALLRHELERRGITVLTGADTAEIVGSEKVSAVRLKNGQELPADLVVMAVGIRPNTTLGKAAGLACGRGIQVDDAMTTSDPAILSVGECVEHRGQTYGLVAPLFEMAKVAAARLAGSAEAAYTGSVTSTKLKVTGVDVFSAGDFTGGKDCEDIVFRDAARGVYKRVVVKENRILGAVLYGDTKDGGWYFQMLKDGTEVAPVRDTLIFGQSFGGEGAANPKAAVAALPDSAEICGCNGVCKGTIVTAITEKGLSSLDEVRAHTKASASCGSCTGQVEQLLALTLGDGYAGEAKAKPMCKCTDRTHDEVRRAITALDLKTIPDVMQRLEWRTPDGCHHCRPALNYYLLCEWPGEYKDDSRRHGR